MDNRRDPEDEPLESILGAIRGTLWTGRLPESLPDSLSDHPLFNEILADLVDLHQFALAIAKGDLTRPLRRKGAVAGSLKSLQANLRHLTWQTQQIAQGDFSQQVEFMGEFSEAFNSMVTALAQARAELQQREAELSRSNKALHLEIAERERAEEALRQRTTDLEASNAELDAYAHTVAHDLKNPLSAIISYSHLLTGYAMPPQELKHGLNVIQQGAYKAVNIVDELLLLASVRKLDVFKMDVLDMGEIVREVLGRLRNMTADYQAEIASPQEWPLTCGYRPWVEEIWMNYISNAIKYGGNPSQVTLGAEVDLFSRTPDSAFNSAVDDRSDDRYVRFWVRDNGMGLAPEKQTELFKEFSRLGQVGTDGHGLGLSIVRRIVEKLGGEVGVESRVGEGSSFYFTLPAV